MKICVVGAGAIGSLFAGHLGRMTEVWILTRREEHAYTLRTEGLRVSGKAEFVARVRATADPEGLPLFDLAIVCTKATDLDEAMTRLGGLAPEAVIMTTQNGLGAEDIVRRHGSWPVISAVTFMSGTRHSDSHVEYELDAPTWLGPWEHGPSRDTVIAVADLLVDAGLKAEAMDDVRPAQWSKLIFNATVNSISALTELPHDHHFREEGELWGLGNLVRRLIDEGKQVARGAGIPLNEDPWEMNLHAVRRGETDGGAYGHNPSMLDDVLARRPTEVDFITGQLVQAGIRHGVEVPLHLALYQLVKAKESTWVPCPPDGRSTDVDS
jgi:2-dehydropantoate 2-reductase